MALAVSRREVFGRIANRRVDEGDGVSRIGQGKAAAGKRLDGVQGMHAGPKGQGRPFDGRLTLGGAGTRALLQLTIQGAMDLPGGASHPLLP